MTKYTEEELKEKLLKKLSNDKKYVKIGDQYDKMAYAVSNYSKVMAKYGGRILQQCATYDRENGKSRGRAQEAFLEMKEIIEMKEEDTTLSEEEWSRLSEASDTALRYLPIEEHDWKGQLFLFKVYLLRAEMYLEERQFKCALSDARHAASVLRYYGNPVEMFTYFEDADEALLLKLLTLQKQLMATTTKGSTGERVKAKSPLKDIDVEEMTICGYSDVEDAIQTIRKVDSLFEEYKTETGDRWLGNYQLSEKLRLCSGETGRFFKASGPMAAEETILTERVQLMVIFKEFLFRYCDHCHQQMATFWPCGGCTEVGYCSLICGRLAYEQYHRYECGIWVNILGPTINNYAISLAYRHFVTFGQDLVTQIEREQAEKPNRDLSDFFASEIIHRTPYGSLSGNGRRMLCSALTSQMTHRGEHELEEEVLNTIKAIQLAYFLIYKGVFQEAKLFKAGGATLLENLATGIMRARTNAFGWDAWLLAPGATEKASLRVGCATALGASILDHSCDPNVFWYIDDGVIQLETTRPILPGDDITLSYGPKRVDRFYSRQLRLRRDYIFYCRCELCLFDAATSDDTLKCQEPTGVCPGPLLQNCYHACLTCGHDVPEEVCIKLSHRGGQASTEFMRILKEAYFPETDTNVNEFELTIGELAFREDKLKAVALSSKKVSKLEATLSVCRSVYYSGSFHLLEKCALLLKVYQHSRLPERATSLVSAFTACVSPLSTTKIDESLVKYVYLLEYLANFYETLSMGEDRDTSEQHTDVWKLCRLLNGKLQAILQYDQQYRGHFYPVTFKQREASKETPPTTDEISFSAEELHFRQLYTNVQRRLQSLASDSD